MRRTLRRRLLPATALAIVVPLLAPDAALAGHGHGGGPSAAAVAAGRAAVASREQQVRRAATAVARAQAEADRLGAQAETAVEAYDAARVARRTALGQVAAAGVVLKAATDSLDHAQRAVSSFARAAYETGGVSALDAFLSSGGPSSVIERMGTIGAISAQQRNVTQTLDGARVYQLAVARQARAALARADAATAAAARAKAAASAAVANQATVVAGLRHRRHVLARLLGQARAHASALERARLAAIAEAKARAAARARQRAARLRREATGGGTGGGGSGGSTGGTSGGATGPVPGTVSPATERQAVSYAESQIGKPYEWGADGPDTYDCSGLTMWAYAKVGVRLEHYTGYQWQEGAHIATSAMRPGDLAFFATDTNDPSTIHHVGMYIGNGEMVEAPYTGANVRISSVWRPDLIGVVRPYTT